MMNSRTPGRSDELISWPEWNEFLRNQAFDRADEEWSARLRRLRGQAIRQPIIYFEEGEAFNASGGIETIEAIMEWLGARQVEADFRVCGSLGLLSAQPVIGLQIPGKNRLFFQQIQKYEVGSLLEAVFSHQVPVEKLLGQWGETGQSEWEGIRFISEHHWFKQQERRILALNGIIDPTDIQDYLAWGGYQAAVRSLLFSSHDELVDLVREAGLLGRSGSAYPVHRKWEKVLGLPARKRILICNADESDPAGFMHRVLMEGNPHLILEGMILAAYAVGAGEAIFHTRNRYGMVVCRMEQAIHQAKKLGLIGSDILGSGFTLDIKLNKGPGAYVTGEETALIASLEGRRGMPRPKPPYPTESGLNGNPTLVHNVETLAQLPSLLTKGSAWYRSAGLQHAPGTKLFSLSGNCTGVGVIEIPFGMSLETVISQFADWQGETNYKAVLPGGLSGRFIPKGDFGIGLDYRQFEEKGLVLGSGSLVFLNQEACILDLVNQLMHFIQRESCGKCIPCREGTRRMAEILQMMVSRSENNHRHEALRRFKGVTELAGLAEVISQTSLCGLGKGAANPLLSALEFFRDEVEEHVFDRFCRAGSCRDLRRYTIDPQSCTGCYVCYNRCPEQAIVGTPRQVHAIIPDKCTGCGVCFDVCKFNAVLIH